MNENGRRDRPGDRERVVEDLVAAEPQRRVAVGRDRSIPHPIATGDGPGVEPLPVRLDGDPALDEKVDLRHAEQRELRLHPQARFDERDTHERLEARVRATVDEVDDAILRVSRSAAEVGDSHESEPHAGVDRCDGLVRVEAPQRVAERVDDVDPSIRGRLLQLLPVDHGVSGLPKPDASILRIPEPRGVRRDVDVRHPGRTGHPDAEPLEFGNARQAAANTDGALSREVERRQAVVAGAHADQPSRPDRPGQLGSCHPPGDQFPGSEGHAAVVEGVHTRRWGSVRPPSAGAGGRCGHRATCAVQEEPPILVGSRPRAPAFPERRR